MIVYIVFYFGRVYVFTVADKCVLFSPDHIKETILVNHSDIAGMDPAIRHNIVGFLLIVPIAGEKKVSPEEKLALLSGRNLRTYR